MNSMGSLILSKSADGEFLALLRKHGVDYGALSLGLKACMQPATWALGLCLNCGRVLRNLMLCLSLFLLRIHRRGA